MSLNLRILDVITHLLLTGISTALVICIVVVSLLAAPKSGRVAFIKTPDVYTMDADGSNVQQLTSFGPGGAFATLPAWAPNNELLVFTMTPANSSAQLWIMNSDGTHQRLLVGDRFYSNTAASFSPDGQSIVFARCLPRQAPPIDECAIFRFQIDGSGLADVTNFESAVRDFNPVYSPDGKTLAFESYNRGRVAGAIYLMDTDGSNIRRLTPPLLGAAEPSWSAEGSKIAFSSNCCTGQNSDIWVIGRDGRGLTRITNSCVEDCVDWDYLNSSPSWSPEGEAIAFSQTMDTPVRGIWIVDAKGAGENRRFSTLIRPDGIQPRWSHAR